MSRIGPHVLGLEYMMAIRRRGKGKSGQAVSRDAKKSLNSISVDQTYSGKRDRSGTG